MEVRCDMRITKQTKNVKAATTTTSTNYDQAIEHIKCAIGLLGSEAKTNVVARESIANLGVVMFDIKGSTQN